jgi:hypothetical protein
MPFFACSICASFAFRNRSIAEELRTKPVVAGVFRRFGIGLA